MFFHILSSTVDCKRESRTEANAIFEALAWKRLGSPGLEYSAGNTARMLALALLKNNQGRNR